MCDGCGKCCLHKLEDEETGELHADQCRLPAARPPQRRCSNYKQRRVFVPDCVRLDAAQRRGHRLAALDLRLPAARRGQAAADWHYLISGDRETVHRAGMSVRGWTVSEDEAGDLEHHLVDREL